MQFKTQAEIYRALLDGKRLRRKSFPPSMYVYLMDGRLVNNSHNPSCWSFDYPEEWSVIVEKGSEVYLEHKFESFYDSRHGEFYDFQVGTKAHEFALQNKNLTRAPSKDFVKKFPVTDPSEY